MNAMTLPRPAFGQTLARGLALFWNSADAGIRWLVLAFFGFFLLVALGKGATPSLYPLALGLWWMWVPRIALAHREARQENVPHIDGAVRLALLPALGSLLAAYLWSGNLDTLLHAVFWSALVLAASLMSARKITVAYLVMIFVAAPILGVAGALMDIAPYAVLKAWVAGSPPTGIVASFAAVAVLAAAWMWRGFLHRDIPGGESIWSKPLVLMTVSNMRSTQTSQQFWTDMPFGAWMLKDDRTTAQQSDVAAMRRWMGAPFAPLTRRQQVARVLASGVFGGFLLWLLRGGGRPEEFLDLFPIGLAMMTATFCVFVYRLHHLMQSPSGVLTDLALLPGWKSGDHAKQLLLRAVWHTVRHEYAATLIMMAMLVGALWSMGALPLVQVAGQLLAVVEVLIILHAILLAVLGGRRLRASPMDLAVWIVLIAIPVGTLAVLGQQPVYWGWMLAAWIAVLGGGGGLIHVLRRIYLQRPHPFLQH